MHRQLPSAAPPLAPGRHPRLFGRSDPGPQGPRPWGGNRRAIRVDWRGPLPPRRRPRVPPLMELVEREAELARLERALARASDGHGGVVVVSGVAGIGKSAVLAAARATPAAAGMRLLRARGAELEGAFGFGLVRQPFEPLLLSATPADRERWLAGPAALAAQVLGLPVAAAGSDGAAAPPDPGFAVLHGLYWLCANLAAEQPLGLVVDDAHWADAPSLRFLAFLQPRLEELPVALVVATRPGEGAAAAGVVAALAADAATELVEPGP